MCFDTIVRHITPLTPLQKEGMKLTRECSHCHGGRWQLMTTPNKVAVKDMTKEQIKTALYGYKDKTYGYDMKDVMEAQMDRFTKKQIDTIVEYIIDQR